MEEKELNKLLDEAEEGNRSALKKIIEYFKSIDDVDNAAYYQSKLDEISEEQEKQVSTSNFDYQKEYEAYSNGDYNNVSIRDLKENVDHNPYYCAVLAEKYLAGSQYTEALGCYEKEISILNACKNKNEISLFMTYYQTINVLIKIPSMESNLEYASKYFEYLSNALEIETNDSKVESYKYSLYKSLAYCYSKGIGCEQNLHKAEEYDLQSDSFTIEGCLKCSIKANNEGKLVDEEEWLEKAQLILASDKNQLLVGNSNYYKEILLLKIALRKDNPNLKIKEYKDTISSNNFESFLTSEESQRLNSLLSDIDTDKCLEKICDYIKDNNYTSAYKQLDLLPETLNFKDVNKDVIEFLTSVLEKKENKIVLALILNYDYDLNINVAMLAKEVIDDAIKYEDDLSDISKKALFDYAIKNIETNNEDYLFVKRMCKSEFVKSVNDEDLLSMARLINKKDHDGFDDWANKVSEFNPDIKEIKNVIEKEEEDKRKIQIENKNKKLKIQKKILTIVVVVVLLFTVYKLFIYDGVDKPKNLISDNVTGYTKEIITNYGDEVKDVITFEDSDTVTFNFKKRYTTLAAVVGVKKGADALNYATVEFSNGEKLKLEPFGKYEVLLFDVKDQKSFSFYSDSKDIYLSELYLLDSDSDVEKYENRIAKEYKFELSDEKPLSESFIMYSSGDNCSIENNKLVMDGTSSEADIVLNAYGNYKSLNGKLALEDANKPATVTIYADDKEIYTRTFDRATTRDFSISLNKPEKIKIEVINGKLIFDDVLFSIKESSFTTIELQSLMAVNSENYTIKEEVKSSLGLKFNNVMFFGGYWNDADSYAEFKLGKNYTTLTIKAVTASDNDYKIIRIKGDNNETLDKALIHKIDDVGYQATINVEGVDVLRIETSNGNVIIPEATLSNDETLLDNCKDRPGKVALNDMEFVDGNAYLKWSHTITHLGAELFDFIGRDSAYDSVSKWSFTVYSNEKYNKFYGKLYADASNRNEGVFKIYKDDELIYTEKIKPLDDMREFSLDVSGAKFIKVEYSGEDKSYYITPVYIADAYME